MKKNDMKKFINENQVFQKVSKRNDNEKNTQRTIGCNLEVESDTLETVVSNINFNSHLEAKQEGYQKSIE